MSPDQVLSAFRCWRTAGWVRALDERFVHFLSGLDTEADGSVLLAAGLVSHALGLGHISLDCRTLQDSPGSVLALPPEKPFDMNPALEEPAREFWQTALAALASGAWIHALRHSVLVEEGEGGSPLVLDGERLYLRRNWQAVVDINRVLGERGQPVATLPETTRLHDLIASLFPRSDDGEGSDWQKIACATALRYPFSIITGGPGTGKTWTMVKLLGLLQAVHREAGFGTHRPLRVLMAAPTGKAAARMTESVMENWTQLPDQFQGEEYRPDGARTLHRLLGSRPGSRHFRHNARNPIHADVVIVDEASMIDLHMMHCLLDALAPHTRLVLLGDKDQLASVEPGAVFGDLCTGAEDIGFDVEQVDWLNAVSGETIEPGTGQGGLANQRVMLRQTRRFNQDIAALARAVNSGLAEEAAGLLDERAPALNRLKPASETDGSLRELFVDCGYARYLDIVGKTSSPTRLAEDKLDAWIGDCLEAYAGFQVLTATRTGPWGVEGLNARIRQWLAEDGLVDATGQWFHGRPVMIVRNDYRTGLMNGDVGLCLALPHEHDGSRLRVVFRKAGGELRHFSPARMPDCQTAWAMTVHKAQGSEFKHTVLVLPERDNRVLTRELVYTGLTRARSQVTVISPKTGLFEAAVERRTQRRADGFGFSSTD